MCLPKQDINLDVKITNDGTINWPGGASFSKQYVYDDNDCSCIFEVEKSAKVGPGDFRIISINLQAPEEFGPHIFIY